jgi:hypothetical protein
MSHFYRFGLGGLGGLLPVLATLVAIDLSSIATLVDHGGVTEGLCVGYAIRVFGLFALGGVMAAINSEVTAPIALVQIGIAAPALVTSYLTGAVINKNQPSGGVSIISTAYAEPLASKSDAVLAGFLGDVVTGITPGFRVPEKDITQQSGPALVIDQILGEAIPQLQNIMVSMSRGCSGGSNGMPPVSWGSLQTHGYSAANAFSAARTSLATGQASNAVQQINSGLSELDVLVNGLHENCSGGSHGEDPVGYGAYVGFRNNLKTQLQTAQRFL